MSSIAQVRGFLSGKTVAIVGGDDRPQHRKRLEEAFGLRRVIWIPTRSSDPSARRFSPLIRRGDVALVVGLLGLLRHQHVRDLRSLCRDAECPFVPYWRSPHPEGLAIAILSRHRDT